MTNTNISKDTIIRTIISFVLMFNMVLTLMGKNPLPYSESDMYSTLSTIAGIVGEIWVWWKNNSFTKEAIEADSYMRELKQR